MENLSGTALVTTAALGGLVLAKSLASKSNHPPGPRPLPLIGNAIQMPQTQPWLTFSKWAKTYGDLIHLEVLGQHIVVINSVQIAKDLLDKRSAVYSDRPKLVMAGELIGYGETVVLQPYGDNWRRQRKVISHDFNQTIVPRWWGLQEHEARVLVRNAVNAPNDLKNEVQLRIGILIMRVTYGYPVKSRDDRFLTLPLTAMDNFSVASTPGNFLVDFIPAMKYMPPWLPGSGFLETAKQWKQIVLDATWGPFDWGKKNLETRKTLLPNMCSSAILESPTGQLTPQEEHDLVWAASAVMGGGMDTNMSTALTFFIAMIHYPEVQRKAQAELDAVIGQDRLPTIADRPNLPYVRSLMAEVFRWQPAVPLGLPHGVSQDDVYENFHIPKGTLVMPNVWHMLHNPDTYENPEEFIPERYKGLDSEMAKVYDLMFGFGRRVCPGQHFAEGTLFSLISTTLATCNILPAIGADGKEIKPKLSYSTGTIVFPDDFELRLEYRSDRAKSLIAEVPETYE